MSGISAVNGVNPQIQAMAARRSASEETGESQAERVKEVRQGEEKRAPAKPPSPEGVGALVNLTA